MQARRIAVRANRAASIPSFWPSLSNPRLAGQSLGQLADWLGVEITDRHSALGDALTTARVFQAMVPKLREGGIRTYAEAAQACRSADRRDRPAISRRLDDVGCGAGSLCPAGAEPDRQLSVSPPHPRCHVVAAENHRCRPDAWRGVIATDRGARVLAAGRAAGRAAGKASSLFARHRDRARRAAGTCDRGRGRARARHRAIHEPPACHHSGGGLRLSRDRSHGPAQNPSSRCHR